MYVLSQAQQDALANLTPGGVAGLFQLAGINSSVTDPAQAVALVMQNVPQDAVVTVLLGMSVAQLALLAQSDPAVLAALEAQSPVALSNRTSQTDVSQLSLHMLSDRAAFMLASNSTSTPNVEYRDLQLGITLGDSWLFTKPVVAFAASAGSSMTGTSEADSLYGGAGNDTLDGGAGGDWLEGGAGDDSYVVDNVDDHIEEHANGGIDRVLVRKGASATGIYVLGDNIEMAGLAPDAGVTELRGNALDNTLAGNADDNILDGGLGADTLYGGKGNDTYIVRDAGDVVVEYANEGIDTVKAYIDSYQLANNVENLRIYGKAGSTTVQAIGNDLGNEITAEGNVTANILGGAGNDILRAGNRSGGYLSGGAGSDTLYGGTGADMLDGYDHGEHDLLFGGAGDDEIAADGDYVEGGAGDDLLYTSGAASVFAWGAGDGLDSVYTAGSDVIKFKSGASYSVTASFAGPDLVLSTGSGEGVVVKEWRYGGKASVELPDGTTMSAAQVEAQLHPAITGWNYTGGTYAGNSFAAVLQSVSSDVAQADASWTNSTGWSLLQQTWDSGLSNGSYTGRTQDGHAILSWSMNLQTSVPNSTDPTSAHWANLTYDFWQTDSGSYQFAITSLSAGNGGQTVSYFDNASGAYTTYTVPRNVNVSVSYGSSQYVIEPAVTSAVLYEPGATASRGTNSNAELLFSDEAMVSTQEVSSAWFAMDGMDQASSLDADTPSHNSSLYFEADGSWLQLGANTASRDVTVSVAEQGSVTPMERTRVSVMPVATPEFQLLAA